MSGGIGYLYRVLGGEGEYPSVVGPAVEGAEAQCLIYYCLAVVNYADGVEVIGVKSGWDCWVR
jgi:hypothetical protein